MMNAINRAIKLDLGAIILIALMLILSSCATGGAEYNEGDNFSSEDLAFSNLDDGDEEYDNGFDDQSEEGVSLLGDAKSDNVSKEFDDSNIVDTSSGNLFASSADNIAEPQDVAINAASTNTIGNPSLSAPVTNNESNTLYSEDNNASMVPSEAPMTDAASAPQQADVDDLVQQNGSLWWVGYNFQRKDKQLKVQLLTKGRPGFDIIEQRNELNQPQLVVRFYNSSLRQKMRRALDASEFRSPVSYIETKMDSSANHVDVVLTLRAVTKPELFAKRGNVQLTFNIDDRYFGTKIGSRRADYVAHSLAKGESSVFPTIRDDSERPRGLAGVAQLLDPAGNTFTGTSDRPQDISQLTPEVQIPAEVDAVGLPVSDFVQPNYQDDPTANGTGVMLNSRWPSTEHNLLAVAQESWGELSPANNSISGNSAEILSETSVGVSNDIQGMDSAYAERNYSGKPIFLEFQSTPMSEVLKAFSEQIGTNFIFSADIAALPVTIKLRSVPWDAALDAIMEAYQLGMAKISENVIRIDRVENLSTFMMNRDRSELVKSLGEPRRVSVIRLSNAVADESFANRLTNFFQINGIENRTRINVDSRTNTVFIEAPPVILQRAKALIERLDVPEPQVEIISRLIEVTRGAQNFLGISWGGGLNMDAGRGLSGGALNFPNSINSNFSVDPGVSATTRTGSINFNIGSINDVVDLGLRLRMEESRNTTEILQSNRVIVADRQRANISAGKTAYFRPTQSPIMVSGTQQQGSQSQGSGGSEGGSEVSSVNFSLSLDVAPEVTNDGHVRLNLTMVSEVPGAEQLPGADISTNRRELTTVLKKRSGQTAVIGGIYDTRKTESEFGIPFISRIPIIGALFRSRGKAEEQTELMMMITPTIVGKDGEPLPAEAAASLNPMNSNEGVLNVNPVNNTPINNFSNNFNLPENGNEANL